MLRHLPNSRYCYVCLCFWKHQFYSCFPSNGSAWHDAVCLKRNNSPLGVLFFAAFPCVLLRWFDRCALFLSRVEYLARNREKADVRSGKPQEERTVCKTEDFPESLKKKITLITYFRCVLFIFQFHLFHISIFPLDFSRDTKSESDDLFSFSIFLCIFHFISFCHEFFSVWVTGGLCLFWSLLLFFQVLFCKVPGEECHISNRPGQPRHEPLCVSVAQIQEYNNTIWKIVKKSPRKTLSSAGI